MIGLSKSTVYLLLETGQLYGRRWGRRWLIPDGAVREFLEKGPASLPPTPRTVEDPFGVTIRVSSVNRDYSIGGDPLSLVVFDWDDDEGRERHLAAIVWHEDRWSELDSPDDVFCPQAVILDRDRALEGADLKDPSRFGPALVKAVWPERGARLGSAIHE